MNKKLINFFKKYLFKKPFMVSDFKPYLQKNRIEPVWWRTILWGIGLSMVGGQLSAVSIITTATGGATTSGYQGAAYSLTSGDVMRGFIMFKNGFTIPDPGTVFYDAEGPVYGNITFGSTGANTSTLQLGSDLRLGTTGWFAQTSGINAIDGCPIVTAGIGGPGNSILMGGDQTLGFGLTITSSLTIDGCGHTLTVNSSGLFTLDNRATLTLKNMNIITSVPNLFARTASKAGYVGLENVNIYLTQNSALFGDSATSLGMTRIQGLVGIYGPYSATASSTRFDNPCGSKCNILINSGSTLYVGPGVTFDLSGLALPSANKIGMQDSTSVLWLDGCTLTCNVATAGQQGLVLSKGTVLLDDKVVISDLNGSGIANADITKGLIFGDGTTANDIDVRVLGGAYTVLNGCMQYKHS